MSNEFDANLDEKYRPDTMKEVVGQPHIRAKVKNWLHSGYLPHLLFSGPPGVGKTSTAIALAKDLYGAEWRNNFNEFNASENNDLDFIRTSIKRLTTITPIEAPFHIIFLDEADELTRPAQAALRQIMMKYTETTKFILSCNDQDRIISPIQDRCVTLQFKPLTQEVIIEKLKFVCAKEKVTYEDGVLEILAKAAGGSMRQAVSSIGVYKDGKNCITMKSVSVDIVSIEAHNIQTLLKKVSSGDVEGYENQLFTLYYEGGFTAREIFSEIVIEINRMKLAALLKERILDQTGKYDWRISQPSLDRFLQMRCYLNSLAIEFKNSKE